MLTVFFALLSLSTGGIQNFSVVALVERARACDFAVANVALTAFLLLSAFGVLAGGVVADRTTRHGDVAALGFGLTGALVALVGLVPLGRAGAGRGDGAAGFLVGHDHAVARHAGARRGAAGCGRPRLRHRHDRLQHRRRRSGR